MARIRPFLTAVACLAAGFTWAASPASRLQGVSQYARERAESGPEHLWVGLGIALALACAVGAAVIWTRRGKRTGRGPAPVRRGAGRPGT